MSSNMLTNSLRQVASLRRSPCFDWHSSYRPGIPFHWLRMVILRKFYIRGRGGNHVGRDSWVSLILDGNPAFLPIRRLQATIILAHSIGALCSIRPIPLSPTEGIATHCGSCRDLHWCRPGVPTNSRPIIMPPAGRLDRIPPIPLAHPPAHIDRLLCPKSRSSRLARARLCRMVGCSGNWYLVMELGSD